jgi:hypothetical protein
MGAIVDPAIVGYRLSVTDCVKKLPISDCHLVPVADYQSWQTIGSLPITAISVTTAD